MADPNLLAVILSGGSGTRFWPLSKKTLPKQYLSLFGGRTLVQETVDRLEGMVSAEYVYTISTESQRRLLQTQLPQVKHHLFEPAVAGLVKKTETAFKTESRRANDNADDSRFVRHPGHCW